MGNSSPFKSNSSLPPNLAACWTPADEQALTAAVLLDPQVRQRFLSCISRPGSEAFLQLFEADCPSAQDFDQDTEASKAYLGLLPHCDAQAAAKLKLSQRDYTLEGLQALSVSEAEAHGSLDKMMKLFHLTFKYQAALEDDLAALAVQRASRLESFSAHFVEAAKEKRQMGLKSRLTLSIVDRIVEEAALQLQTGKSDDALLSFKKLAAIADSVHKVHAFDRHDKDTPVVLEHLSSSLAELARRLAPQLTPGDLEALWLTLGKMRFFIGKMQLHFQFVLTLLDQQLLHKLDFAELIKATPPTAFSRLKLSANPVSSGLCVEPAALQAVAAAGFDLYRLALVAAGQLLVCHRLPQFGMHAVSSSQPLPEDAKLALLNNELVTVDPQGLVRGLFEAPDVPSTRFKPAFSKQALAEAAGSLLKAPVHLAQFAYFDEPEGGLSALCHALLKDESGAVTRSVGLIVRRDGAGSLEAVPLVPSDPACAAAFLEDSQLHFATRRQDLLFVGTSRDSKSGQLLILNPQTGALLENKQLPFQALGLDATNDQICALCPATQEIRLYSFKLFEDLDFFPRDADSQRTQSICDYLHHLSKHAFACTEVEEVLSAAADKQTVLAFMNQFNAFQLSSSTIDSLFAVKACIEQLPDSPQKSAALVSWLRMFAPYLEAARLLQSDQKKPPKVIDQTTLGKLRLFVDQLALPAPLSAPKANALACLKLQVLAGCFDLSRKVQKLNNFDRIVDGIFGETALVPAQLAADFLFQLFQLRSKACSNLPDCISSLLRKCLEVSARIVAEEKQQLLDTHSAGLFSRSSFNFQRVLTILIRFHKHWPEDSRALMLSLHKKLAADLPVFLRAVSEHAAASAYVRAAPADFEFWATTSHFGNTFFKIVVLCLIDDLLQNEKDFEEIVQQFVLALKGLALPPSPSQAAQHQPAHSDRPANSEDSREIVEVFKAGETGNRIRSHRLLLSGCKGIKIKAELNPLHSSVHVFAVAKQDRVTSKPGENNYSDLPIPYCSLRPFESVKLRTDHVILLIRCDVQTGPDRADEKVIVKVRGVDSHFTGSSSLNHLQLVCEQFCLEKLRNRYTRTLAGLEAESARSNGLSKEAAKSLSVLLRSPVFLNGFKKEEVARLRKQVEFSGSDKETFEELRTHLCDELHACFLRSVGLAEAEAALFHKFCDSLEQKKASVHSKILGQTGSKLVRSVFALCLKHEARLDPLLQSLKSNSFAADAQVEQLWSDCIKTRALCRGYDRIEQFKQFFDKLAFVLSFAPNQQLRSNARDQPSHAAVATALVKQMHEMSVLKLRRAASINVAPQFAAESILKFLALDAHVDDVVQHMLTKEKAFDLFLSVFEPLEKTARTEASNPKQLLLEMNQVLRRDKKTLDHLTSDYQGLDRAKVDSYLGLLRSVVRSVLSYLYADKPATDQTFSTVLAALEALKWVWRREEIGLCIQQIDIRRLWQSNHNLTRDAFKLRDSLIELNGILLQGVACLDSFEEALQNSSELKKLLDANNHFLLEQLSQRCAELDSFEGAGLTQAELEQVQRDSVDVHTLARFFEADQFVPREADACSPTDTGASPETAAEILQKVRRSSLDASQARYFAREAQTILCQLYLYLFKSQSLARDFFENAQVLDLLGRIHLGDYPGSLSQLAGKLLERCSAVYRDSDAIRRQFQALLPKVLARLSAAYAPLYQEQAQGFDRPRVFSFIGLVRSSLAAFPEASQAGLAERWQSGSRADQLLVLEVLDASHQQLSVGSLVFQKQDPLKDPLLLLEKSAGLFAKAYTRDLLHYRQNLAKEPSQRNRELSDLNFNHKLLTVSLRTRCYSFFEASELEQFPVQTDLARVAAVAKELGLPERFPDLDPYAQFRCFSALAATRCPDFLPLLAGHHLRLSESPLEEYLGESEASRLIDAQVDFLACCEGASLLALEKTAQPNARHAQLRQKLLASARSSHRQPGLRERRARRLELDLSHLPDKAGFRSSFNEAQQQSLVTLPAQLKALLETATRLKYLSSLAENLAPANLLDGLQLLARRFVQLQRICSGSAAALDIHAKLQNAVHDPAAADQLATLFTCLTQQDFFPGSFEADLLLVDLVAHAGPDKQLWPEFVRFLLRSVENCLRLGEDFSNNIALVFAVVRAASRLRLACSEARVRSFAQEKEAEDAETFDRLLGLLLIEEPFAGKKLTRVCRSEYLSHLLFSFCLDLQKLFQFEPEDLVDHQRELAVLNYTLQHHRLLSGEESALEDLFLITLFKQAFHSSAMRKENSFFGVQATEESTPVDLSAFDFWMVPQLDTEEPYFLRDADSNALILCSEWSYNQLKVSPTRAYCKEHSLRLSSKPNFNVFCIGLTNSQLLLLEKYLTGSSSDEARLLNGGYALVNGCLLNLLTGAELDSEVTCASDSGDLVYYRAASKELKLFCQSKSPRTFSRDFVSDSEQVLVSIDLQHMAEVVKIPAFDQTRVLLLLATGVLVTVSTQHLNLTADFFKDKKIGSRLSTDWPAYERQADLTGKKLVDYFESRLGPVFVVQEAAGISVDMMSKHDEQRERFLLAGERYAKGLLVSRPEESMTNCLYMLTEAGRIFKVGFTSQAVEYASFDELIPQVKRSKETGYSDIAMFGDQSLLALQEVLEEGQPKLKLQQVTRNPEVEITSKLEGATLKRASKFGSVQRASEELLLLNCENQAANAAIPSSDPTKSATPIADSGSEFFEEFPIVVYLSVDRSKLEVVRAVGYDTVDPPRFEDEASVLVVIASPPINGLNKKKMLAALQAYHASELLNDALREPYHICFEDLNFFSTDSATADPDQLPGLCFLVKAFKKLRAGLPDLQALLTSFPTEEEQMAMAMEESRKAEELIRKAAEKEIAEKELQSQKTFVNLAPDFFRMSSRDLGRLRKLLPTHYWKESFDQRRALFEDCRRKVQAELASAPETSLNSLLDFRTACEGLFNSGLYQRAGAEDRLGLELGLVGLRLLCHVYVSRLQTQPRFQRFVLDNDLQRQASTWLPSNLQTFHPSLAAGDNEIRYLAVNRMRGKTLTTLKRQNFSLLRQMLSALDGCLSSLAGRQRANLVKFQFLGERTIPSRSCLRCRRTHPRVPHCGLPGARRTAPAAGPLPEQHGERRPGAREAGPEPHGLHQDRRRQLLHARHAPRLRAPLQPVSRAEPALAALGLPGRQAARLAGPAQGQPQPGRVRGAPRAPARRPAGPPRRVFRHVPPRLAGGRARPRRKRPSPHPGEPGRVPG